MIWIMNGRTANGSEKERQQEEALQRTRKNEVTIHSTTLGRKEHNSNATLCQVQDKWPQRNRPETKRKRYCQG